MLQRLLIVFRFNRIQPRKFGQILEVDPSSVESIRVQLIHLFQKSGRLDGLDLNTIDSEPFDQMSYACAEAHKAKEQISECEYRLGAIERQIEELKRERASVEALIHEGPIYPKWLTFFSLCLSLVPSLNLIWAGYKLFGFIGFIFGLIIGFILYGILEYIYKKLIHRDIIATWDVDYKYQPLIRRIVVYASFLLALCGDFVFTYAVIIFRLQSGYIPSTQFSTFDWSILSASIATDIILIWLLYHSTSPNHWTRVKEYSKTVSDLTEPGNKRERELEQLRNLDEQKNKLENDISEWSNIITSRYNILRNQMDELFGEGPARRFQEDFSSDELLEPIFPNVSARRASKPKNNNPQQEDINSKNNYTNGKSNQTKKTDVNYAKNNEDFFDPDD
ncbi:MAG: hypothetical protein QNJ63_14740 [Calothrix sp. MO_192.B10]|nr:hypothetical protein [Calothrix sp. MO_192.B10]